MASTGFSIRMSRPSVSWSFRYTSTFLRSSASWPRAGSSQKMAGAPVALARVTPSFTQSRMETSLVWHIRKMSPAPRLLQQDRALGVDDADGAGPAAKKVLSWDPYSSAFLAMSPTLETLPMVAGSNWPWAWQSSITAWYRVA